MSATTGATTGAEAIDRDAATALGDSFKRTDGRGAAAARP